MQKMRILIILLGLLVLLGGCTENTAKEPASAKNSSPSASGENIDDDEEADADVPINEKEESAPKETDSSSEESSDPKADEKSGTDDDSSEQTNDPLNSYSTEEIEYARVWAQLGPNQEIDELNIRYIPPGEPVNPNIANSAVYPDGVIQLSGSRLVDGSVTYRGNGDGTIQVYSTPMRWEAPPPGTDEKELQKDTEDILNNTKLVSIEPRDGQEIISLIERLVFR